MGDGDSIENLVFGRIDELRTTLWIEGQEEGALSVLSFGGTDALSTLATYRIVVSSTPEVAEGLDDALGREVVFVVERAEDTSSAHRIRGVVLEVHPEGTNVGRRQRCTTLLIGPRLAELCHVQRSRVYQRQTVVDIAKELFQLWHIEVDSRLHPVPLKREYCTQVNETDYDFLCRIFSEEGIHFHVEHAEDKSTVVLVNDPRGYQPIESRANIPFRDADGAVTADHIRSLRRERRVRTGAVVYRDYNFLKPTREMTAREETRAPNDAGSHAARQFYDYPGSYVDPDETSAGVGDDVQMPTFSGQTRAKLRLEEQRSNALTFSGTSNCLRLRVGRVFEIADHPERSFNQRYIVTRVTLSGNHGDVVRLERGDRSAGAGIALDFTAVPADTTIRQPFQGAPGRSCPPQ